NVIGDIALRFDVLRILSNCILLQRDRSLHHEIAFFFFQAEDGIRDRTVTGVQTCALPILPMVPIVNQPCLGHIFDLLKRHGIEDSFVTLQYLASVIQDSYGDGGSVGMRLRYSIEESPLGTGGSVRQLAGDLDGTFIVISGVALTDIDLSKVIAFHKERGAAVTLTLVHVPNPLEYGVVITEPDGRIRKFLEKPSWGEVFSDTINTGIYVIEPRVLERYEMGEVFD